MSKMFLAAVMMAVLAVSAKADDSILFSLDGESFDVATVTQQRALLATAGSAVYYSPSYSPSPAVYSPSPAVYSPKASPAASPKASPKVSPKPASPKPCKFKATKNANIYIIILRAKGNWGIGRDAIVKATGAVYMKYGLKKYKVKVIGGGKQNPKKPFQTFKYKVVAPVIPCKGYKEGLRAALRTALKKPKYSKFVSLRKFTIVA